MRFAMAFDATDRDATDSESIWVNPEATRRTNAIPPVESTSRYGTNIFQLLLDGMCGAACPRQWLRVRSGAPRVGTRDLQSAAYSSAVPRYCQ